MSSLVALPPLLPGLICTETLQSDPDYILCRATRQADGRRVLMRMSRANDGDHAAAGLLHEFESLRRLDVPGVLQPLGLETHRNHVAIVFEDFVGVPLSQLVGEPMALSNFFPVAAAIADAVGEIHARRVVCKRLNTASILVDRDGNRVKLVGFGLAETWPGHSVDNTVPEELEGSLAYLAPEQTGRLGYGIDSRSDLYALGIIFYQMLTGSLPFVADSPGGMLYCHVARQPEPPVQRRPDIPDILSGIVVKLLAKDPAARYQSAYGLVCDLDACMMQLQERGRIDEITIGVRDVPQDLRVPSRLYGRQSEIDVLRTALRNSVEGSGEIVVITGGAGIGKSMLAREVGHTIAARSGHFAAGKFDQLRRDIPYSALIEAFQDIVRQLLTEGTDRYDEWRRKLAHALSGNASVIMTVLPQLQLVLGPQPPIPPVSPTEATARFNLVVGQFVQALATREHPLVLLLDDMQWADSASVNLLRLLIADSDITHLMLIFAYRDNEVQRFGPLDLLLDDIAKSSRPVRNVQLRGLEPADIGRMLAETLRATEDEVEPLARVVFAKTQGNAFFVKEFLTSIYHRDLLSFEPHSGQWCWKLAAIEAQDITENVVDLVAERLSALPSATRRAMQLAAAIGNNFADDTLATVCEQPLAELRKELVQAQAEQLIIALSPLNGSAPESAVGPRRYRFVHDRIQLAAYDGISVAARPKLHERIGRLMRRACTETELDERLFEVVNHLNIAASLPDEEGGRAALMALNLRAVRKAKASAAYEPAWRYIGFALRSSETADWTDHYAVMFGIHREAAEVAYLLTNYAEMQRYSAIALERACSDLDQVDIHEILIRYYNSSMQYTAAVETGLKAMRILAEPLPANPTKFDVLLGLGRLAMRGPSVETLRQRPAMTDSRKLAAMRVMSSTASACYFARPMLFPIIVFRMLRLSIQYGAASLSAFAYVCYGFLLCALRGDMDTGYAYGQLALDTLDRFNANELRAKIVFLFNVFIHHWKNDLAGTDKAFLEAAASGLENGDLEFFSYNLYMHCSLRLIDGRHLDGVSDLVRSHYLVVAKQKQDKVGLLLRMLAHVVAGLRDVNPASVLAAAPFEENEAIRIWVDRRDYSGLGYWHCFQTFCHFGRSEHDLCVTSSELAERCYDSLMGQPYVPFVLFYQSLALAELVPQLRGRQRRKAMHKLSTSRRKLSRWAVSGPANYLRKARLLEAEWKALRGSPIAAMQNFDEAVAFAARDGSLLDEGVASERAAKFALSRNLSTIARNYLDRATACYARWGAPNFRSAACTRLAKDLAHSVTENAAVERHRSEGPLRLRSSEIDLEAIMRATRTLSQQVVLADVLRELLTIAVENAGATRALLLLMRDRVLYAEAEAEPGKSVRMLHVELTDAGRMMPKSVLDYALRTSTSLTINDAATEEPFAGDDYVRPHNVRSLMCVPLHNQGEIIGLLYLENTLTANAFSTARLEMVRIFAAQAAISIRNAELYANLERSLAQEMSLASVHRRFVPQQFLVALGKHHIADVAVGDQVLKTMSVLFADMRAYSSFSERMTPKENMNFVNSFFGQIESAIVANRGFIENYYGDGIMALFDGDADDAVKAGIALLRSLNEYNEIRKKRGITAVRVGIGINTGEVMLGTIGAATSIKCSVIGDAVNFARRVESLTKHFECPLLIGESTYGSLKDPASYHVRSVGRVRVKGRSRPETIYEIFDADAKDLADAKLAAAEDFRRACEAYYARDFMMAARRFESCLTTCPADRTTMLFLERCRANALGVPPDWDGADTVTQW